ncbi:chromosomal replication initiator protein DnaA [Paracoccus sp. DMF-8]|uniref:chromosomal replication initiator protein DnaA n=1 Tax=Paracoccus sp. DMF-8 TaxID=3019445 RepID=UPI0023E8DAFB|nr:chromosomal replication initiator protein DnaA [Paracoccus sp. DMF-8]MDF3605630.1 chromosomal replication initiator protein DnaA [Paracoccus sp. DMF-8]
MKKIWGQAREELERIVGADNFATWIAPLDLTGIDDGTAVIACPTRFLSDWVSRHYSNDILKALDIVGHPAQRVSFDLTTQKTARIRTAPAPRHQPVPVTLRMTGRGDDDLAAPLDSRFTFDNFVVGKPNELAHAAARRVAEGGPVTFNPLFLYGGVGLGKTHLMHAIAREIQIRQPEARVLYLSAEQFMYRFVQALRERTIMDFKEMFRTVSTLMVDDVQFIAGKDSTQEEFFHTFNALVDQGKQIVISADRAPGEIKDMEERIRSRLSCGLIVDLHPTDYELRLSILQSKTEQFRATHPDLVMAPGVLEFLAARITSNVRVLEGALQRLFAFASLMGREISLDMTQECLADILRSSDRKLTIEEIQRKVAEHYNIRLSDMIGPKRVRTVARPRQIAMYLSKQMTSRSLPEIGRRFGGRDHTTIMHGVRKIEELRGTDRSIAEDLDMLRRLLEA